MEDMNQDDLDLQELIKNRKAINGEEDSNSESSGDKEVDNMEGAEDLILDIELPSDEEDDNNSLEKVDWAKVEEIY